MMQNLKNKRVIVIGGSSGIGLSVARLAHQHGASVLLTSRSEQKAREVAKSIGAGVEGTALDVKEESAVSNLFRSFDSVDHVYISAGGTKLGNVTDGLLEEHMQVFNTRLLGSLRIVRAVVKRMTVGGSITFTGGVSTDRPIAGAWVSGLSTASAEQLARVLVMEFPNVRFNAVSPGYTDTPMWDDILGDSKKEILASVAEKLPVKKIAAPEEVAAAVLFFMTNPSVTGEVIHIDGGLRLV